MVFRCMLQRDLSGWLLMILSHRRLICRVGLHRVQSLVLSCLVDICSPLVKSVWDCCLSLLIEILFGFIVFNSVLIVVVFYYCWVYFSIINCVLLCCFHAVSYCDFFVINRSTLIKCMIKLIIIPIIIVLVYDSQHFVFHFSFTALINLVSNCRSSTWFQWKVLQTHCTLPTQKLTADIHS